jgi:DNA helicase-2/ATP-dependent DNA helicase PcrA|tara:strand:+ start:1751 stop:3274 length:1524 start_codon:yes stop_codon:yes gene_type:complete
MDTKIFRIYGPPGTGKTTALLNKVDDALNDGVHPNKIGYFAFTRQAANEAVDRAVKRFDLERDQLPWFRTLHSFALRLSGIRQEQIMQPEHYRELGATLGVDLGAVNAASSDDVFDFNKRDNPYISLINLARLKKIPLRRQYDESDVDVEWSSLSYVARSFQEYKNKLRLYDFTDMLEVFVEQGSQYCPPLEVSFIDEAQDLSPLQWDVAHVIEKHSERIYCAGDDDQAIYRWAGADVDHFIGLNGGFEVLEQSYRIPSNVHAIASKIAKRIRRRVPKNYFPKQDNGLIEKVVNTNTINFGTGDWLILAQAAYLLDETMQDLKNRGYLYSYRGRRSISEKMSEAVNGWEQLRKGREVTGATARIIYSYMSANKRIKRGFKKLPQVSDDDMVTLEYLQDSQGLLATIDMIWHEAMDRLPEKERAYITALLRRGEKFNALPRINISTIHGSKGGEAENVVLFTDLSPAALKSSEYSPDDLHRVFYVGVTRTKKNLFLVEPQNFAKAYQI